MKTFITELQDEVTSRLINNGVEVHDKDSSANIVYGDKTDTIITTDNISYASQTTVTDRKGVIACRLRTWLHPRL